MDVQQHLSILAVDDNPTNLELLKMTLSKEGYCVIPASNGPSARNIAAEKKPDLILLDIKMPGEDGFEVIKKLKTNPSTAGIPVIFLTGVSEIDAKLSGFELGAVDYITKPFHPMEVIARVRLHLKLSIATNSLIAQQARKLREVSEAQTGMLTTPKMQPEARFGVYYLTLHEAGGDFYEVLSVSEGIFGYFVADFSGHDIKTSYLTASVKALLKQNCSPVYHPVESMRMMNEVLVGILPEGKYLTACYIRLNRKAGHMTIINAGHPPPIYIPKKGEPQLLEMNGDVIGIFKDVFFMQKKIQVSPGDRFYLYSDGLIESAEKKIVWTKGSENLIAACRDAGDVLIEKAPEKIAKQMMGQNHQAEDDVVVLGCEI
ncbi:MAG: SpoIIE family protein phosphatase [Deltaproteobacteria bacterium]|nr:SpoIIE family protein phosphatase [Deltaproteobacteria bacterium]